MGGHKWCFGQPGDIVETCLVDMAEIQHDLQVIARQNQPLACIGQTRPSVGAGGKSKGHAVAKDGRARPNRADRPQAHGVKRVKRIQIFIYRLGAFHVHQGCDDAIGKGGADV